MNFTASGGNVNDLKDMNKLKASFGGGKADDDLPPPPPAAPSPGPTGGLITSPRSERVNNVRTCAAH